MTPSPEPTRAVYARVPPQVADKLDRAAARLGLSKRDVLATLVSDHLDLEGENVAWHPRPTPRTRIISGELHDAVLDLTEAAELLRVSENDLSALAESGEIPGRRIGGAWRFSREALLNWLGRST
ncbi:MAG TPA: helix-turn-helix domain-containing protein [Pseudonocardiaceae bacterium]|jgi:excisionase family DNA binding protein|nr:helix-turn-helix domain-containing protein [Pseudonocardiaceae bacterium]